MLNGFSIPDPYALNKADASTDAKTPNVAPALNAAMFKSESSLNSWSNGNTNYSPPSETDMNRSPAGELPSSNSQCGAALIIAVFNCASDYGKENPCKAFAAGALGVVLVGGAAVGGVYAGSAIATAVSAKALATIGIKVAATAISTGLAMLANNRMRWCFFKPQNPGNDFTQPLFPSAAFGSPSINANTAPAVITSADGDHKKAATSAQDIQRGRGGSKVKRGDRYSLALIGSQPRDPKVVIKGETPRTGRETVAESSAAHVPGATAGSAPDPNRITITFAPSPR